MSLTTTTGGAAALMPRDMREAMDLAKMMASTGFLARELQTPGGAMFVMEQSMRWAMSPFAVAMETSFIQGKPMFSGKIVAAAVSSSGAINGRLRYEYSGEGDNRTVTVSGTVKGETEPRTVTVRLADARTNNKVWNTQPDQQLAYHGARVWARRHTPEVMLGVYSEEEMEVAPPLPPAAGPTINSTAERVTQPPAPEGFTMLAPDGAERLAPDLTRWVAWCKAALGKLESGQAVHAWREAMAEHMDRVALVDDTASAAVAEAIEAAMDKHAEAAA